MDRVKEEILCDGCEMLEGDIGVRGLWYWMVTGGVPHVRVPCMEG